MDDRVAKVFGAVAKHTGKYHPKIWLLGDGRSGTTWLSETLSSSGTLHYYFEPIHIDYSPSLKGRELMFDVPKDGDDPALLKLMQGVFNNELEYDRISMYDRAKFPKGILVKDIYGHMVVNFVLKHMPDIKPVLLLRHPAAVALSKIRYKDWTWKTEPLEFFERESLKDYLSPYREEVEKAPTIFHKHFLVWCIIHRHLFDHVARSKIKVVYFENLIESWEKIYKLGLELSVPLAKEKVQYRFNQSSASVQIERDKLPDPKSWLRKTSNKDKEDMLRYLQLFGLENVYDKEGTPTGYLPFANES